MNPSSSLISTASYTLKYRNEPGLTISCGMEYKLRINLAISFETNACFFISNERNHLDTWQGSPDLGSSTWGQSPSSSWPNSFNNVSVKIGINYFK